ncbi:hypothetical protein [Nocardia sp. SYP-A9097]|uniref:hypothetical protein n=1 Tax=Nocardia sp. SYP-A9097 TaxID=2663237 RepID=UPI001E47EFE7|nr:hypothetical protein [Nocardia sp. SYP-A9097]
MIEDLEVCECGHHRGVHDPEGCAAPWTSGQLDRCICHQFTPTRSGTFVCEECDTPWVAGQEQCRACGNRTWAQHP